LWINGILVPVSFLSIFRISGAASPVLRIVKVLPSAKQQN
jgi:hypothetical protein